MLLKQLKGEGLVALRESAVADHVREHNRGELAMVGAILRHITNWTAGGMQGVRAYQKEFCKAKESEATHNWNSALRLRRESQCSAPDSYLERGVTGHFASGIGKSHRRVIAA